MTINNKIRKRSIYVKILLLIILSILAVSLLMFGNTFYTPKEIFTEPSFAVNVLRKPRMLAGIFSGIAFGIAGYSFQTILRNPLASPDVIGITAGTGFSAVFCMLILSMSGAVVSFISLIAGLFIAIIIYFLSGGENFKNGRLILIGIGVQAMINAGTSFLLLRANQYDVPSAMRWLSGSLNGIRMDKIFPLIIVTIIAGGVILSLKRSLEILLLGEETAVSLGVNTKRTKLLIIILSVLLIAFATAVTGPIAFVAFLSGPIAKALVGNGRVSLLEAGLVGAILILLSDLIGQFAFDTKFPVGVITGIIGAPYLLYLLMKMNKK